MAANNSSLPVSVYFVKNSKSTSSSSSSKHSVICEPPSAIMQEAFKTFTQRNFDPQWINVTMMRNITFTKADIFVMDTLEGNVFEYLQKRGARIIRPHVVQYCDPNFAKLPFDNIPVRGCSITSQCMRHLVVTSSNFNLTEQQDMAEKVTKMCGTFDVHFHARTNVLVSNSVLTPKYQLAAKAKIPVLRRKWIDDCWQRYQYEFKRAGDPKILKQYQLPVLQDLIIVLSQVDYDQRESARSMINANGGTYSRVLSKMNPGRTLLLLREKGGEKYEFAKRKCIPRLHIQWLYDSIKANYALPQQSYNIDADEEEEEDSSNDTENQIPVDETGKSKCMGPPSSLPKQPSKMANLNDYKSLANELNMLATETRDTHFLDNCVICAVGFSNEIITIIRNVVRQCGAIFLTDLKDMVTHVITGPDFDANNEQVMNKNIGDKCVTIEWLIDSLKNSDCPSDLRYKYNPFQACVQPVLSNSNTNLVPSHTKKLNSTQASNISTPVSKYPINSNPSQITQNDLSTDKSANEKSTQSSSSIEVSPKKVSSSKLKRSISGVNNKERKQLKCEKNSADKQNLDDSESTIIIDNAENESINENDDTNTDVETDNNDLVNSKKVLFMLSGFEPDEKEKFVQLIREQLQVEVDEGAIIAEKATHLILKEPCSSEKAISSMAAGMWILKPEYVNKCVSAGKLLPEDPYEWGKAFRNNAQQVSIKLMLTGVEWRIHRMRFQQKAFHGWTTIIMNHSKMIECNERVLHSGGAVVHHIESYDENQLRSLMNEVKYILIDLTSRSWPSLKMSRDTFIHLCRLFSIKKKLIRIEFVTRFVLNGPNTPVDMGKVLVSYEQLLDCINRATTISFI